MNTRVMEAQQPSEAPTYDIDFYSDEVIKDPYPHYASMRALGPVVYLPRLGNFATTQYAVTREVLKNWQVFPMTVGADKFGSEAFVVGGGSNIVRDPPLHDEIRAVVARPLMPQSLKAIRAQIDRMASELVDRLLQTKTFDGMDDLASYLPLTLVRDLVGLPEDGRENMLKWAAAAFDIAGIQNERGQRGALLLEEMRNWIRNLTPGQLKPGSFTARIHELVLAGEVKEEYFLGMMNDYIAPSLDTTISATGHLLYHLARNPQQWQALQNDASLVPNAVNEAVRMNSPIRSFARSVRQDYSLGGVRLPVGARIMALYASANRDEEKFPNADRFDVTRANARDHLGFGYGIHLCVGMYLAKAEMESLLTELLKRVARIEVGEPTITLNNSIHGFSSLPMTLHS